MNMLTGIHVNMAGGGERKELNRLINYVAHAGRYICGVDGSI